MARRPRTNKINFPRLTKWKLVWFMSRLAVDEDEVRTATVGRKLQRFTPILQEIIRTKAQLDLRPLGNDPWVFQRSFHARSIPLTGCSKALPPRPTTNVSSAEV